MARWWVSLALSCRNNIFAPVRRGPEPGPVDETYISTVQAAFPHLASRIGGVTHG